MVITFACVHGILVFRFVRTRGTCYGKVRSASHIPLHHPPTHSLSPEPDDVPDMAAFSSAHFQSHVCLWDPLCSARHPVMVFLLLQAQLAVSIRRTLTQPLESAKKRFRDIACEVVVVSGAQQEFAGHARSGISFLSSGPDPVHVLSPRSGGHDINEGGFLWMAAPKRRTSHSKKRMRMTNKWLKPIQNYTFCQTCGNPKLLNVLCGYCFKDTMRKTAEYRNKKEECRMKRSSSRLQIQALDDDTDRNSQPV